MMKRIKSLVIATSLIFSLCFLSVQALYFIDAPISGDDTVELPAITETLHKYLSKAHEEDFIPVTIELTDSIDLVEIEKIALSRIKLSSAELNVLSVDGFKLSEKENEEHQKEVLMIQDKIANEKKTLLKEHYNNKNMSFIASTCLANSEIESVGVFTPFIRKALLTPSQIKELSVNPMVLSIDYVGNDEAYDFETINNTCQIINGDIFVDNGYTGGGIRVGLVESGHPKQSVMGADFTNIFKTDSNGDTNHATITSGIIKKMAPSCSIYSRSASGLSDAIADCTTLIETYNVHVINISYGSPSLGSYNPYSREMDKLIKNTGVPIVVSSGNSNDTGTPETLYVNNLGLGANVLTVGAVTSFGTDQSVAGAYSLTNYSLYKETSNVINKPDICAPGRVQIYSFPELSGTSIAAPHVTGTVIQMMARNGGLVGKATTIKAAIMASASYNAGSDMSYVWGTSASNIEGAGVIDAGFCYQVARNGRRTQFDATSENTTFTYNVYCDYKTLPFRIACAWDVVSTDLVTQKVDFDLYVYKDGVLVAASMAYANSDTYAVTNYEIVELSTEILSEYGVGYYQVEITSFESFDLNENIRIGLAWEQR